MSQERQSSGFTLIEMLVVLALVGLLAAVAMMALREPYRAAQFQDAVERVAYLDGFCRSEAGPSAQRLVLRFDLDEELLDVLGPDNDLPRQTLRLASGVELDQVITGGQQFQRGRVEIPVWESGLSATYAVRLQQDGGRSHWLLLAGVTGQQIETNDEREIMDAISLLSAGANPD